MEGVLVLAMVVMALMASGCIQAQTSMNNTTGNISLPHHPTFDLSALDYSSIPSVNYKPEAVERLNASVPPPPRETTVNLSSYPIDPELAEVWKSVGWNTSNLPEIVSKDCQFQQLLEMGAQIQGWTTEEPPCMKDVQCGGPSLSMSYPPFRIGLIVDGNKGKVSETIVENVPSGSHIENVSGWSVITTEYGVVIFKLNTSCE